MNWRDVRILYMRELRAAMRERLIVVNSILLPILLYPVILWITFSGLAFVQGLMERVSAHVAVYGVPEKHRALVDSIAALEGVRIAETPPTPEAGVEEVRAGRLDALVEFLPPTQAGLDGNFRVRLTFDGATDRGARARAGIVDLFDRYRYEWLKREAKQIGVEQLEVRAYRLQPNDVATGSERGAFRLARMIPMFLVVMVAVGCFMPSIDSTAGERERATWETLMTTAASRSSIVFAKYLYVATLGVTAGVLNVIAVALSLGPALKPLLGDAGGATEFHIRPLALMTMFVGAALLALFFAAAMMILASFARTFKDGQSMITPIYWLALIPILLGATPDQTLTPLLALIPIANVAMMIRDAIGGVYHWWLIGLTILVEIIVVASCLRLARAILGFEDLLLGSYSGSFWRFTRDRLLRRRSRAVEAGS